MRAINKYQRYQVGLSVASLYPSVKGKCACGCGSDLPKGKRNWASNECRQTAVSNFFIIKGDIYHIRKELLKRDGGGCRSCGLISDDWEADHILSVCEGGGGCDLSNFQTLCKDCHKAKTKTLLRNN